MNKNYPYAKNYPEWDKEFNMEVIADLCYKLLKNKRWSNVAKTKYNKTYSNIPKKTGGMGRKKRTR